MTREIWFAKPYWSYGLWKWGCVIFKTLNFAQIFWSKNTKSKDIGLTRWIWKFQVSMLNMRDFTVNWILKKLPFPWNLIFFYILSNKIEIPAENFLLKEMTKIFKEWKSCNFWWFYTIFSRLARAVAHPIGHQKVV